MNSTLEYVTTSFIETKEHRRFAEFCDACRRQHYSGLCHGAPGVGKTISAYNYSQRAADSSTEGFPIFYTPPVANSARQIAKDIGRLRENAL